MVLPKNIEREGEGESDRLLILLYSFTHTHIYNHFFIHMDIHYYYYHYHYGGHFICPDIAIYCGDPQSILISTILDTQSTAHACRRQVQ
jgi:hypothetical protein